MFEINITSNLSYQSSGVESTVSHQSFHASFDMLYFGGYSNVVVSQFHGQAGNIKRCHTEKEQIVPITARFWYSKWLKLNLLSNAMSCSEDVDIIDQRSTTKLSAVVEQGSYPRPLVWIRIVPADDSFRVLS